MDTVYCNKCGLLPQVGQQVKPCPKPRCCKPKRRCCCKPKCCSELSTTLVPASLGDDKTGKAAAKNGLYENMVVSYEANGAKYIYDANGVYTLLVEGERN